MSKNADYVPEVFSPAWWDEAFSNPVTGEPYSVPTSLRIAATEVCTLAHITGSCDPMYVANVIANESKWGDGRGHFDGTADLSDRVVERIAERFVGTDRLLGAYATCCRRTGVTIPDIVAILGRLRDGLTAQIDSSGSQ